MGPHLSSHPVAVGRRRVIGLAALAVSLICVALLVAMVLLDFGGAEYAAILAVFPLAVAAPAAVVMLRPKARVPEVFELHEGGLAHVLGGVRRAWTWEQVRAIDVVERGAGSYTGSDVDCRVRFDDGVIVRFTGLTQDCRVLLAALGTHRADAAGDQVRADRLGRAVAVLGAITVGGAGLAVWSVLTATSTPDPDGSSHVGLAFLALAGAVPALISAIMLGAVLLATPKPPRL